MSDAKEHVMYTEFTPSNSNHTYGITYGRSVTKNDPFQNRPAEVVMSNYIIPSIESLVGWILILRLKAGVILRIVFPKPLN